MSVEVDYYELTKTIEQSLLKSRKEEFLALALINGNLFLNDENEIVGNRNMERILEVKSSQYTHEIIKGVKELLGDKIQIMENGKEITFEED